MRVFMLFALLPVLVGWVWLSGSFTFATDAIKGLPEATKNLPEEVGRAVSGGAKDAELA